MQTYLVMQSSQVELQCLAKFKFDLSSYRLAQDLRTRVLQKYPSKLWFNGKLNPKA